MVCVLGRCRGDGRDSQPHRTWSVYMGGVEVMGGIVSLTGHGLCTWGGGV